MSGLGKYMAVVRPVFTHGPLGPGPRAANFQGQHIKKIEIEVWYAGKKTQQVQSTTVLSKM